ncbi:hypothetical protein IJH29_02430 [Candidatus Saccharibacteria bacterium]|nr:hypothetical protein [Candidatus Saccharibacteria bacterium]
MRKMVSLILSIAILLLALPYLSMGASAFMAKWAYDWGMPVPVVKIILIVAMALILFAVFSIVKKAVVLLVIGVIVMVGLNALGVYNMKTDPKDIVAQVSQVAKDNSETIVTASQDLFYQATAYVQAVNPVQTVMDFASGDDSYWYVTKKDEELDMAKEVFEGYEIKETKEAGEFKAYHLVKVSAKSDKNRQEVAEEKDGEGETKDEN